MKTYFSKVVESKIALMIYGKTPSIQAGQKKIFGSKNRNQAYQLFDQLTQHTKEISQKSLLDTFWIYDHELTGHTFGERYAQAFEKLFALGYEYVISIGNDIPDLHENLILKAVAYSQSHQAVLGPTQDGGDYLIALHRDSFEATSFSNLPWNTNQLHLNLKKYLEANFQEILLLKELIDIDDFKSFSDLAYHTNSKFFQNFFIKILQSLYVFFLAEKNFSFGTVIRQDHRLRAPPVLL